MPRRKLPTFEQRRRIAAITGAGEDTIRRAYIGACPTRSIVYAIRCAAKEIGAPLPPTVPDATRKAVRP